MFDNITLYFECRVNKTHSFRLSFLVMILPTGKDLPWLCYKPNNFTYYLQNPYFPVIYNLI